MTGFRAHASRRNAAIARFCAVAGVLLVAAAVTTSHAAASTSISITSGGCSGGGTGFCYNPESASATVGSPVTWTNQSGVAHTVTVCTSSACPGAPANTGSDSFNVSIAAANGSTGSFTFTSPGMYTYYCTIHGYASMHGAVTVTGTASSPPLSAPAPAPATLPAQTAPASNAPGSPSTPATGAAPGVLGLILGGAGLVAVVLALAARLRRR